MKIMIDGDGCPVVDAAVRIARDKKIDCLILCDASHDIQREGAVTLTFISGPDQVDFELVNRIQSGDIVITQDYGLATMCLARNAFVLNQDGREYTKDNIDGLLLSRDVARKIRRSGGRIKGQTKRTRDQDTCFENSFLRLVEKANDI